MRLVFTLLICPALAGAEPGAVEALAAKVSLNAPVSEGNRHFWTTANFRIDADVGIGVDAVHKLAVIGESTFAALRAHPLPLFASPEGYKPRISLYADAAAYEAAGAAKGSAGYYIGMGEARVMIRADYFLNAVAADRGGAIAAMDEDLAVHELVHLGMHRRLIGLPQWFVDGIAEYFGSAHRGGGRFSFARMDEAVRDHLRGKLSPRDPSVRLLPVSSIASLDHKEWLKFMNELAPEERYPGYGTALLLTHYHLHGGPERLGQVREMLDQADRRQRTRGFPEMENISAIEAALIRFWAGKGLTLRFARAE